MSLLSVEDLTLTGPAGVIVEHLSFGLAAGEALCLAGPSGSGKSLTALALLGLLPPGITASGRIDLAGMHILTAPEPALRRLRGRSAGFVFQDPAASLDPLMTAGQHIDQALALHGVRRDARPPRIAALLGELGLDLALARRYPHRLSGGERQRVAIAIALANDPQLLIADEPTTALDGKRATAILDLLTAARQRRGLALLLITHQQTLARRYATRSVQLGAPHFPAASPALPAATDRVLLHAHNITVRYGRTTAVSGASFTLREGETLGLTGPSGAGKTSLAFALFDLVAHTGAVTLAGQPLAALPRRARAAALQLVMQNPAQSLPSRRVAETLREALALHQPGQDRATQDATIGATTATLGLADAILAQRPATLSGGQAQRVALARALLIRPRILVLDEPTAGLDPGAIAALVRLLAAERAARGLSLILISHDAEFLAALTHRTLTLESGVLSG